MPSNSRRNILIGFSWAFSIAMLFLFMPAISLAQTGAPVVPNVLEQSSGDGFSINRLADQLLPSVNDVDLDRWQVIGFIAIRFILVAIIVYGGARSAFTSYRWGTYEKNDDKAYENKASLAFWLLIVTLSFISLAVYRILLPNYLLLRV